MRPLIGFTCGEFTIAGRRRYGVNVKYTDAVIAAGGDPIIIPPGAGSSIVEHLDALLLTGGADIDPRRYGESEIHPSVEMEPERDETEFAILDAAAHRGLPVFGICRGMQVINVWRGGSLHQHLDDHPLNVIRDSTPHEIKLADGSSQPVNSLHHQGVKRLGEGLKVTASSPDGLVEGLESEDGLMYAVQCHPEELAGFDAWSRNLFEDLVERARRFSASPAARR